MAKRHKLTVYDDTGCNLCSRLVRFVLRRDKNKIVEFKALVDCPLYSGGVVMPDSIIVEEDGKWYLKSDAALKIAGTFSGLWRGFLLLRIVPKRLRDIVYDFIARNRYKWFGKNGAACALDLKV